MPHEVIDTGRLRSILKRLQDRIYEPIADLKVTAFVTAEPTPFQDKTVGRRIENLQAGDVWGELWDCAWFHFEGNVPASAQGQKVVLLIDVNGELCLVDEEGTPTQGLTNVNSEFDKSLGLPGKRVVHLAERAVGDEHIDLWGDAGCNDLFGRFRGGTLREARIAICHEDVRTLYYDFEVLLELAEQLPEGSARRAKVLQALYDAGNILRSERDDAVARAASMLRPELARSTGDPGLRVSAIGHAHIDLAWLWPIRETIRKGARTFATALRMMEQYPDYVFGASQPQLYQWIKDRYPKLYDQVRQRIAEGRWEAQGAMWVEPDSNIVGGEALVRQILYGKRFFEQEFGQEMKVLWVPDIFGYSASLPQILRKSGVDYMMTQKLSWNQHTTHPHHTFHWEGIDGSRVLTHMPPEDTYNSPAAPRSVVKAEKNYLDKNVANHLLMLFGIGDGGGGPGEEHLERLAREKDLQGLLPVTQEPAIDFFEKLSQEAERFKVWRGELYLEMHQGTLTSQARNKRFNRKLEKALRELEFAGVLHHVLVNDEYPRAELEEIWKEVLLYQFHDILPGSSITRVYQESLERYEVLLDRVQALTKRQYEGIANQLSRAKSNNQVVLFNSLPWARHEWIQTDKTWRYVVVPPFGFTTVQQESAAQPTVSVQAEETRVENQFLRVCFHEDGTIRSVYDKVRRREVVAPGARANALTVYRDEGNAWDFPEDYRLVESDHPVLESVHVHQNGPFAEVVHQYRYGDSTITQRIRLTENSRRLDFHTAVDWRESGKMLRTSFPVDVHAEQVNCEIQFGYLKRNVHRNTLHDFARDEICAHQWIDLSEPDYGVSLLNDSKYGHRAYENVLDLNLLRSSSYPDPDADRANHEFVYSLYPHEGDFVDAKVYQAAYELNVPLQTATPTDGNQGTVPSSMSLLTVDSASVMVEAIKLAEDDDDMVIRLFETSGSHCRTRLGIGFEVERVEEVDLMERSLPSDPAVVGAPYDIALTPFEIKTLKVKRRTP